MKMKGREMRDLRESLEIQILVQMLVDVLGDSMHSIRIDVAALRGAHGRYFFGGAYMTNCVQRKTASVRPVSLWVTMASHTCVVLPQ